MIIDDMMSEDLSREPFFSQILNSLSEGIAIEDLRGNVAFVNERYCRIIGIKKSEVLGRLASDCIYPNDIELFVKKAKSQPDTQLESHQIRLQTDPCSTLDISVTVKALYDHKKTYWGNLVLLTDSSVCDIKKQKQEHYSQLLHMERLAGLGMMMAMMSQELNQRINVVQLILQELRNRMQQGSIKETDGLQFVDGSLEELTQMISIIEINREASRFKKPQLKTERLLSDALGKLQSVYHLCDKQSGFEIIMDKSVYDVGFIQTQCDLEQIAYILISNAFDAAIPGQSNKVEVSCEMKDGELILRFSDNCSGIKSEELHRIFEPFYTTKSSDQSTGLGLTIVEGLLEIYGGRIQVRSQMGVGTTFTVILPNPQDSQD
ncbi:MAG: sensor histidine kinase [Planctomycetota bacterium]